MKLTPWQRIERAVFLIALAVVAMDLLVWHPG